MSPLDAQPAVRFRELFYLYLKPFFLAGSPVTPRPSGPVQPPIREETQ